MVIQVENLNKVYRKGARQVYALKDVSFELDDHRILGILGQPGAGKTTLLKILAGITPPDKDSGKIKIFAGRDIEAVKGGLGFCPENPEFFKKVTPYELLRFSLRVSGLRYEKERIIEALQAVGLLGEEKSRVKDFSEEMLKRLGIALALVHSPAVLILDEPLTYLDPGGKRLVKKIIGNYFQQGKTILFSTTCCKDIEALCTDVLVLKDGQILLAESLSELKKDCGYRVEVEMEQPTGVKRKVYLAKNEKELWGVLDEVRIRDLRIVRIESGIALRLEKYYES